MAKRRKPRRPRKAAPPKDAAYSRVIPYAQRKLERGPHGHFLCRWCKQEVKPPRRTLCSDACAHEWALRTRPSYVRSCLRRRDKGVCARCGMDMAAFGRQLRSMRFSLREHRGAWPFIQEVLGVKGRSSYWDAHHGHAVHLGGGCSPLGKFETICIYCHRRLTAEQARQRSKTQKGK